MTISQPYRPPVIDVNFEEIPEVDIEEIRKALSQMKANKTTGEDKITTEMLNMAENFY